VVMPLVGDYMVVKKAQVKFAEGALEDILEGDSIAWRIRWSVGCVDVVCGCCEGIRGA
jgi:hypothetical protein